MTFRKRSRFGWVALFAATGALLQVGGCFDVSLVSSQLANLTYFLVYNVLWSIA